MIKVYCYERCTTCKKALKWLDDNKIKYELIDIKGSNPDKATIKAAYEKSGQSLKKFFNISAINVFHHIKSSMLININIIIIYTNYILMV